MAKELKTLAQVKREIEDLLNAAQDDIDMSDLEYCNDMAGTVASVDMTREEIKTAMHTCYSMQDCLQAMADGAESAADAYKEALKLFSDYELLAGLQTPRDLRELLVNLERVHAFREKTRDFGSFERSIMEAISKADASNLRQIEKGFPNEVKAWNLLITYGADIIDKIKGQLEQQLKNDSVEV